MTNRCTQAFCAATEMYPWLHVSGCYSLLLSQQWNTRLLHVNEEEKKEEDRSEEDREEDRGGCFEAVFRELEVYATYTGPNIKY